MNAALLMMTSTLMTGADVSAAPPAAPAPVAAPAGPGCGSGGCGPVADGCCDSCGGKAGLFDRLKGRMGCRHRKSQDCCAAPAPATCCAPTAPACAPVCDTCAAPRPNLCDRLKGRFGRHKGGDCCAPACDGCAAPAVGPVAVPPGGTMPAPVTPSPMPKPMTPSKTSAGAAPPIAIPTPGAVVVPPLPVTPVSGPKLTGTTSPY